MSILLIFLLGAGLISIVALVAAVYFFSKDREK